jgi:long-chain acyl-CoA synthetase
MTYDNFAEFVDSFNNYGQRTATTTKPFLVTNIQTYGQLQKKIYQTANYLKQNGIKKGDRVFIVAPNSPQWIQLFFGAQLIGAITTPVDARNNIKTTLGFIEQTKPKLFFRGRYVLPELDKIHKTFILEDLDYDIKNHSDEKPEIKLSGKEPAVIIFTSGTTASPKGVVLTQRNLLSNVEGLNDAIKIEPDWRILSILPLSHSYELIGECCMLSTGVGIYYLPRITPLTIAKALNEYKITILVAVPQLLIMFRQKILQTAEAEGKLKLLNMLFKIAPKLPLKARRLLFSSVHKKLGGCLEIVITGSAPIPPEVSIFWEDMGVKALQGYGLTETSPILTVNRLDERRADSQGMPLSNVRIKIARDGEILAKGPNIFKGYYKKPLQTAKAFTPTGWFKTGDVGKMDGKWLLIQGRAKFAIVLSSGLKVFPEDIEVVADKFREIKEVCVVGIKKPEGEEVQAIVISEKTDKEIDRAIAKINQNLEEFQYISSWQRWPEKTFPRTLLLKIDRNKIQGWANNEASEKQSGDGKKNDDQLINIIRLVIAKPNLAIKDSDKLAEIGLDSLRRMSLASMIEEQLNVVVDESKIGINTSVKDLRKLIKKGGHVKKVQKRPNWGYNRSIRFIGNVLRETLVRGLMRLYVKIDKVEGREYLTNLTSPAIFIFNHVDGFDGSVVYQSLPLRFRNHLAAAAADDMLIKHKLLSFATRLLFAGFNLSRKNDILPSLEYTAKLIDNGWNIALAPEGKISKTGQLQTFKTGIGLLAVETGMPIVPVKTFGLKGTMPLDKNWPQKHSKVIVKIGEPIVIDRKMSYQKATEKLHKALDKL